MVSSINNLWYNRLSSIREYHEQFYQNHSMKFGVVLKSVQVFIVVLMTKGLKLPLASDFASYNLSINNL